jgi:hypothetical protein
MRSDPSRQTVENQKPRDFNILETLPDSGNQPAHGHALAKEWKIVGRYRRRQMEDSGERD